MYYQFNHIQSVKNGAWGPLSQMDMLGAIIEKPVIWGTSHYADCIEAPDSPEERAVFEDILSELKLSYRKVDSLPCGSLPPYEYELCKGREHV
jgi:hypothetical protein